jgi:hypothetical protein
MVQLVFISLLFCLYSEYVFAAEIYQSEDENGAEYYTNMPSKDPEKWDFSSEKYEVILPPKQQSTEAENNKLDYINYLNEKLMENQNWMDDVDTAIKDLEKSWRRMNVYNETETNCKILLEGDAYYSTTYPDGYSSTTYTWRANPSDRVYCKEYLQNEEQQKMIIESRLGKLYNLRSQLEQNIQLILQELNK